MHNLAMETGPIDLSPMRKALARLEDAQHYWLDAPDGSGIKAHLRSAVIQSFEFSYELSVRALRRVLMERAGTTSLVADLSFNDLLRHGADAGLLDDPLSWRRWLEMRNATSHTYDETKAERVAHDSLDFVPDARQLLDRLTVAAPS